MDGIAWAGSAMVAARTRLEIAAGNLANVSSDGFRAAIARGTLTSHGVRITSVAAQRQGALRHTGRPYDLAIVGAGAFRVRDAGGHVHFTRNGAFERDRFGCLRDDAGRALLGRHGPLHLPQGATIDAQGRVQSGGRCLDRLALDAHATLQSGYLESADVDAIGEMVTVLAAQRSFESAQKVVAAIDGTRQKADNDVARVK